MTDVAEMDGPGDRRNSIGTLTGWQLLANQVASEGSDTFSGRGESNGGAHDQQNTPAGKAGQQQRQRARHARSPSSGSTMSDDSGLGPAASSSAANAVTPRPHQWLYKEYKIQDEIGSGGFGRVCRARRLTDGKVVVVKEIKTTALSAKQKAATMDEVEVLAKLNHPNIVKYHDCFMDDVYINIVMEHCNAGDLAGLVKRRAGQLMPEGEVMSLFVQICLALHYVHAAGVLHRDLKTSNVLITSSPSFGGVPLLKLGDFGVAKINSADSSMASTIVGTPQYLSPEMCDNKPYGKKSDVWALGCVLYELCTLSKAFDLGNGGISGVILKIMRGAYSPLPAAYGREMHELVGSMLQTDPSARPSVLEVLGAPYVRRHLLAYLEWARGVPEAHPEILLAGLGGSFRLQLQQQQQQGGGGAGEAPGQLSGSPTAGEPSGSSCSARSSASVHGAAPAAAAAAAPAAVGVAAAAALMSGGGACASGSDGSSGSSSSGPTSAPLDQRQQQQRSPAPGPSHAAAAGPASAHVPAYPQGGGITSPPQPRAGSSWQQQQQQQQQQGGGASKQSLAQEQINGLQRLRSLKSRLQLSSGSSFGESGISTLLAPASERQGGHAAHGGQLATAMSIDSSRSGA